MAFLVFSNFKLQTLNYKLLKASSMLESLVAMVIILGAFAVSCMIYVNITASDNNREKLEAQLLINQMAIKTKQEQNFIDEITETEFLTIEKTVIKYPNTENLNQLTIKALNKQGKIISEQKELVAVDEP